jgi:predicted PhzF superfamily epimerase YddE/YHI9
MLLDIYQVNAFTAEPFKGNPAAVCITQDILPVSLMLKIAKEMAVSETAFLSLKENKLRWFTPSHKHEESNKLEALGIDSHDIEFWGEFETKDFLVLKQEDHLHSLAPNFRLLEYCTGRGMVISALSSREDVDIVCRYFAPWVGVNEDPVTGSAYCALAPYWGNRLGKTSLIGYQESERGGYVSMLVTPRGVEISGQAVIVIRGTLTV